MTTQELIQEMIKCSDELAVESVEWVPTGKFEPIRKNKKKRVQKKWAKKYGMKPVFKKKKCKRIDFTVELFIEFCQKHNLPIPSDFELTFSYD